MFGIENLKKAAKLLISFGMQTEEAFKDGFKTSDLFKYIDEVAAIPDLIANKQAIIDEFKDLTAEERSELVAYIQQELSLENKALEEAIEAALETLISILVLTDKIKSLSRKTDSATDTVTP